MDAIFAEGAQSALTIGAETRKGRDEDGDVEAGMRRPGRCATRGARASRAGPVAGWSVMSAVRTSGWTKTAKLSDGIVPGA